MVFAGEREKSNVVIMWTCRLSSLSTLWMIVAILCGMYCAERAGVSGDGGARQYLVLPLKNHKGSEPGKYQSHQRVLLGNSPRRNATFPLHGAVKDLGYFYSSLYLGTPPKKFSVIVDTGSTMTYVPCSMCGQACGPNHQESAFDPAASSTCASISCHSDDCKCGAPLCACSSRDECMYTRSYAEQSSSSGVLMEDVLRIHDGMPDVPVRFGCETRETGEIYKQQVDGLLGLGKSDDSLIQQLVDKEVIDNEFSLCFGLVEGEGALILGHAPALNDVTLGYTPLVESPTNENYYTVEMKAIQVNNVALDLEPVIFATGYATVLDSGTTFSYLPTKAFRLFAETVSSHAIARGLFSVPGPDPEYDDICFGGATSHDDVDGLQRVFPVAKFIFQGGVELELTPLQYLFIHTFNSGKYCLGVFDNGDSGTLLGGITFRNVLVQYDVERNRIGFGKASCKELGLKYRAPCSYFSSYVSRNMAIQAFADGDCEPDDNVPVSDSQHGSSSDVPREKEEIILPDDLNDDDHVTYDEIEDPVEHTGLWVVLGWVMLISLMLTITVAIKKTIDLLLRSGYHPVISLSSMDGSISPRGSLYKSAKAPDEASKCRNVQYIPLSEMHSK